MTEPPSDTKFDFNGEHLRRVCRICMALPEATEKLSHGEPTFFVRKKVFTMFANNHHNDGHVAVWIPAAPGVQPYAGLRWATPTPLPNRDHTGAGACSGTRSRVVAVR